MTRGVRAVIGVVAALAAATCARSPRAAPADSATAESSRVATAPVAVTDSIRPSSAAAPASARPRVGKVAAAGGPQRAEVPPRASGCGGPAIVAKVTVASLGGATDAEGTARAMRVLSDELLAPVKGAIGAPSISPAIRAFRVRIVDTSATERVLAMLRASPRIESAALDECKVMIRK